MRDRRWCCVTSRLNKTIDIFTMTRNVVLTEQSASHSKICEIKTSWNGKVKIRIVVRKIRIFPRCPALPHVRVIM